jgi:hypothetical protein
MVRVRGRPPLVPAFLWLWVVPIVGVLGGVAVGLATVLGTCAVIDVCTGAHGDRTAAAT